MGDVFFGVLCVGAGLVLRTREDVESSPCISDLKGLEILLEEKKSIPIVVVYGTVGSISTVDNNPSAIYVEETASLKYYKTNGIGLTFPWYDSITLSRKDVPWYLDDGTARVDVTGYQKARFNYTLEQKFSTKKAKKYFPRIVADKTTTIPDDKCNLCRKVLKIDKRVTIVGMAVRDKDGAAKIEKVYHFYNGRKGIDKVAYDMESLSKRDGNLAFFLTIVGVTVLAALVLN